MNKQIVTEKIFLDIDKMSLSKIDEIILKYRDRIGEYAYISVGEKLEDDKLVIVYNRLETDEEFNKRLIDKIKELGDEYSKLNTKDIKYIIIDKTHPFYETFLKESR